jgi:hypothetical protein
MAVIAYFYYHGQTPTICFSQNLPLFLKRNNSNISQVDEATLERFLELVNTTGNFGSISEKQLVHKMDLLKKHVPDTCEYSLRALAELLGIHLPINKQH